MEENQQDIQTPKKEIKNSAIRERLKLINQVKTAGYGLQDEKDYLLTQYEYFLQAVQNGEKKIHLIRINSEPSDEELANLPKWDEKSDFAEWINEARRLLVELRIPEIKEKLKLSDAELNPTPFQRQILGFADEMTIQDPEELGTLKRAEHEYIDWQLAHDKETCDKYLSGKIVLTEKELIADMLDREIGKIALRTVDKLGRRLAMGGKPMPHIDSAKGVKESELVRKGINKAYDPKTGLPKVR